MKDLSQILAYFPAVQELSSYQLFGNGHIHDTYQIKTATQTFILQRINHVVFKEVKSMMRNIVLIAEHLETKPDYTLSVLRPEYTDAGTTYVQDKTGNYWRLFPFIKNTTTFTKLETPAQAYSIAHAFGTFIRALSDLPTSKISTTIPNFHNGLYRLEQLKSAVKKSNLKLIASAQTALDFILSEQKVFETVAKLDLPSRIVHNDTKADNILLDSGNFAARCVIDLDTVMPGTLLSDFGDMVRTCTNSEVEDSPNFESVQMRKPIFDALQSGFLAALEGVITEQERASLLLGAKWIILEQACRFLTDFLEGNPYYKIEYPTHNLVRTGNQIALYQSLKAQLG